MADPTEAAPAPVEPGNSLLDRLGALRAQREAETTTDMPLPGFKGELWATFRLPKSAKASQVQVMLGSGNDGLLNIALELIAQSVVGLYTFDGSTTMESGDRIMVDGQLRDGFQHLPGGSDLMPIAFDARLDSIPQLCPPRAGGRDHTPETRVRSLFVFDMLAIDCAVTVSAWANGAFEELSTSFVGESRGGPR